MKHNTNLWMAGAVAAAATVTVYQINWPRLIFRGIFSVVAPAKERWFPSDDTTLSPQARGMAWVLLAGPPPPHNVGPIRTLMRYFWPHVWPAIREKQVQIQTLPTPRTDSETLLIWPSSASASTSTSSRNGTALIHLHGGGMVAGTTGTERGFAVELAKRLQVPVLSIDYRLVPEYLVEDAVQDVVTAYRYFCQHYPDYTKLSLLGGSAGAGLALLATLKLQQDKHLQLDKGKGDAPQIIPMPTSLVLLSPGPGMEFLPPEDELHSWLSLHENAPVDGYMAGEFYQYVTSLVYGPQANRDYFRQQLSKNNLQRLPPCWVTIGTYEVLLDGARKLVKCLKEAHVQVDYKEYFKMQHCHLAFFEFVPEASAALEELIQWVQASWK